MGGAGAGAAGVVQLGLQVLDLGLVHADHLLVVQLLVPLVVVAELLYVLGQLRVVLLLVLAVQLGDLDLFPDLGLVQLLLQELLLELARLVGALQLILQVDALQRLVLEVLLGVVQLLLQLGVLGPEVPQLGLVRVEVGLQLVESVLQAPLVLGRRLVGLLLVLQVGPGVPENVVSGYTLAQGVKFLPYSHSFQGLNSQILQ